MPALFSAARRVMMALVLGGPTGAAAFAGRHTVWGAWRHDS